MTHKPSKEALDLAEALRRHGVECKTEFPDGHKHVDIGIPEARLYIELEGSQHYLDPDQIITDFKRDHYSNNDGFATLRIPNPVVHKHLDRLASAIHGVVKEKLNR